ncbi:MAG: lamin tail domain-containing protein [Planctomycetes bacterium]|nr:lamin tail domain-containing protein [Planctomycetota bacterium]
MMLRVRLIVLGLIAACLGSVANAQKFEGVLITEVMRDHPNGSFEYFEVTNLGTKPVDIKGMKIYLYESTTTTPDAGSPHVIKGKVLQPGEVFVFAEGAPKAGEEEIAGISWSWTSSGGLVLTDANDKTIDAVFVGSINSSNISNPTSMAGEWQGPNTAAFAASARSLQRVGTSDSNSASDWVGPNAHTIGKLNAGLEPSMGVTWLGNVDADWNNPLNWEGGLVPTESDGVVIPATASVFPEVSGTISLDSLDLESDTELALAAGATIQVAEALSLATNSRLNSNGQAYVNVAGEVSIASGASIASTDLVLTLNGDVDQSLTLNGVDIGNLVIDNPGNDVTVKDDWTSSNSGSLKILSGSRLKLDGTSNDFSGTIIDNQGLLLLGVSAGGAAQIIQSLTIDNHDLGNVVANTADALDEIEFLGAATFNTLRMEGFGPIRFTHPIEVDTILDHSVEANVEYPSISGSANLVFDTPAQITVLGALESKDLIQLNGTSLSVAGALSVSDTFTYETSFGSAALNLASSASVGHLKIKSLDPFVAPFGLEAEQVGFDLDGSLIVSGTLSIDELHATHGNIQHNAGSAQFGTLTLDGSHSLQLGGNTTVETLSVHGMARFEVLGSLSISVNAAFQSSNTMRVSQTTFVNGNAPLFLRSEGLSTGRFEINNPAGVTFSGTINLEQGGTLVPALRVTNDAALVLSPNDVINFLNSAGASARRSRCWPCSNAAAASAPRRRPSASAASHGVFELSGRASLRGLSLENFGAPSAPYAFDMANGAILDAFNDISISGVQAGTGAIRLASSDLPSRIDGLHLSGTSGTSISAASLSGFTIQVNRDIGNPGNLYRAADEDDPNNVLIWDLPAVLDILGTSTLPNALAEQAYSHTFVAEGGNQPLNWTIANAPAWLSINPTTGTLTGAAPRTAVGIHTFVVLVQDASLPSVVANRVVTLAVDDLANVALTIISDELAIGRAGNSYGFALAAVGGLGAPYQWTLVDGELPEGIALSSSGLFTGVLGDSSAGVYEFQVRAQDSFGNAGVRVLTLVVQNNLLSEGVSTGSLTSDGSGGCALTDAAGSHILAVLLGILFFVALVRRSRRNHF